jgi:hypothetical protein
MTTITEKTQAATTTTATQKPDFGNGRYSALMEEVWHDSQSVFGIDSAKAEKLARQVSTDVGVIMASATVKVKLGKLNDDGKLTISEACKVKSVTMTDAVFALKALHYAGEAGKNGMSFGFTKWHPTKELKEALARIVD